MKFEIKRKIDDLGRLCIPVAFRDYYGIGSGDRVVLLSVRNGVQIAKAEFFVPEQIPRGATVSVDRFGRIVIPCAFRREFVFMSHDTLCIVPNETCMLVYKETLI